VLFKCKHVGVSWAYGRFNDVDGKITLDSAKPENSKVEITIQAASVDTNAKDRDAHLMTSDFLDAKQFPTATFKSKSVAKKGDGFAVTGDLALHGVTKSVTIDMEQIGAADVPMMGKSVGYHGTLTIKRGDYGIVVPANNDALGEEVYLTLSVEAHQK
jgi:polyisoprenoid-binding protein YceI